MQVVIEMYGHDPTTLLLTTYGLLRLLGGRQDAHDHGRPRVKGPACSRARRARRGRGIAAVAAAAS